MFIAYVYVYVKIFSESIEKQAPKKAAIHFSTTFNIHTSAILVLIRSNHHSSGVSLPHSHHLSFIILTAHPKTKGGIFQQQQKQTL
jgi:hypothetical protein